MCACVHVYMCPLYAWSGACQSVTCHSCMCSMGCAMSNMFWDILGAQIFRLRGRRTKGCITLPSGQCDRTLHYNIITLGCLLLAFLTRYHDGHDRLLVMEKEHLKVRRSSLPCSLLGSVNLILLTLRVRIIYKDHLRIDVMQHTRTPFPTIPGSNSMWTFRWIGRESR